MNKAFWSIPGLAVYLYVITILTQFGFDSYFAIPSSFIGASITANTVYFYILVKSILALAISLKWWWLIILPLALTILKFFRKKYLVALVTLLMIISAYGLVSFGSRLAANQTEFFTPSSECPSLDQGQKYIIPEINNGEGILIPIDASNKMSGGFLVKNLADLNCKVEYSNVGLIKQ